jgi:RNA polymerase sigma factor (TIGR02999 family)
MEVHSDVTRLLQASADGDRQAFDRLFPAVYDELRRVAHNRLRSEREGHTLNTTALVHEAYLKLVDLQRIQYKGRAHFFAVAAQAMRNILVSYARRATALRRGGTEMKVPLDEEMLMTDREADDILNLDAALETLKTMSERQYQVVECRFFAGLDVDETAAALGVSTATVKRDWAVARAWLNRELGGEQVLAAPGQGRA